MRIRVEGACPNTGNGATRVEGACSNTTGAAEHGTWPDDLKEVRRIAHDHGRVQRFNEVANERAQRANKVLQDDIAEAIAALEVQRAAAIASAISS